MSGHAGLPPASASSAVAAHVGRGTGRGRDESPQPAVGPGGAGMRGSTAEAMFGSGPDGAWEASRLLSRSMTLDRSGGAQRRRCWPGCDPGPLPGVPAAPGIRSWDDCSAFVSGSSVLFSESALFLEWPGGPPGLLAGGNAHPRAAASTSAAEANWKPRLQPPPPSAPSPLGKCRPPAAAPFSLSAAGTPFSFGAAAAPTAGAASPQGGRRLCAACGCGSLAPCVAPLGSAPPAVFGWGAVAGAGAGARGPGGAIGGRGGCGGGWGVWGCGPGMCGTWGGGCAGAGALASLRSPAGGGGAGVRGGWIGVGWDSPGGCADGCGVGAPGVANPGVPPPALALRRLRSAWRLASREAEAAEASCASNPERRARASEVWCSIKALELDNGGEGVWGWAGRVSGRGRRSRRRLRR
eukprot:scaffold692_cov92-Isochrysis_galbana.AAC.3